MTTLRPYQRDAIDATMAYWDAGGGHALVSMATGTGKSVVLATLAREMIAQYRDMRVLMLTHVKELLQQNAQALLRTWPQAPIGIYSAGLSRRDAKTQIVFASIQSVYRRAPQLGTRDLIIVDEAHLVPRAGDGMYRTLFDGLSQAGEFRVLGLTATPYRMDSGRLDQGAARLFDRIVYDYGIGQGIRDGYLSPLVSYAGGTEIDVSNVTRRGGEFVAGALEAASDIDEITQSAVSEIIKAGEARKSWLVFAAGVRHAEHIRDAIRAHGVSCETVTGETPTGERDRIIRAFKAGHIRCLTNAQVLTTGFDAPAVDLIAMLRPTLSTGLYVQICGRGTRLAPQKTNCLILDFAGNIRRHGPVDAIDLPQKTEETKTTVETIRAKTCPSCEASVAIQARTCPHCGHEWPRSDVAIDAKPEAAAPVLTTEPPRWAGVTHVRYFRHEKPGSPPSLRVEYEGDWWQTYREWIFLEHESGARDRARSWWRQAGGTMPAPSTVDEAIKRRNELSAPVKIKIRPDGKYWRVCGYEWPKIEQAS